MVRLPGATSGKKAALRLKRMVKDNGAQI